MILNNTLFLCATPLQARICLKIIEYNNVLSFDLIYFTQNDSLADELSFKELSSRADNSCYMHVVPKRFGLFSQINQAKNFLLEKYDFIYLANIDKHIFRYIIKVNSKACIFTFDDGTANFIKESNLYAQSFASEIKSKLLMLPSVKNILKKIRNHFTIYKSFENIVCANKLIHIDLELLNVNNLPVIKGIVTFFLGQPFSEYLSDPEITRIKAWTVNKKIDYYVQHPREKEILLKYIPVFEMNGYLAEDVIGYYLSLGVSVKVISCFTTVYFNISHRNLKKTYLSVSDDKSREIYRTEMMRKTDAEIVFL